MTCKATLKVRHLRNIPSSDPRRQDLTARPYLTVMNDQQRYPEGVPTTLPLLYQLFFLCFHCLRTQTTQGKKNLFIKMPPIEKARKVLKQFCFPSAMLRSAAQDQGWHRQCYSFRKRQASVSHDLLVWTQSQGGFYEVFIALFCPLEAFSFVCFSWIFNPFKTMVMRVLICIAQRTQFQLLEIGMCWCATPAVLDHTYFDLLKY